MQIPYWNLIAVKRHIGYEKKGPNGAYWVARLKNRQGQFRQFRLGQADETQKSDGVERLSHAEALTEAERWFARPDISASSADRLANFVGMRFMRLEPPSGIF